MKTDNTLKNILLDYINHASSFVPKWELHMIAEQNEYSPEYAGRELRKMAESKEIQVSEYKGKRGQTLVKYASLDTLPPIRVIRKPTSFVEDKNGQLIAVF